METKSNVTRVDATHVKEAPLHFDGTYGIALFQLSDIHWPETSLGGESFEEHRRESAFNHFLAEICDPDRLKAVNSAHNVLILGGDNIAQSDYSRFQSFRTSLLDPLLALRRPDDTKRPFFDAIVAVPGNHDIEREKADKFDAFKREFLKIEEALSGEVKLITPFSQTPFYGITTPFPRKGGGTRCIQIWAVNSAEVCGYFDQNDRWVRDLSAELLPYLRTASGQSDDTKRRIAEVERIFATKIRAHDPGYVNERDINQCRDILKGKTEDLFRMAIIHHNSIPFVNDDNLKYKFWNANEFNSHLLDHRFRLLLHGHQHVGEAALFSKSRVGTQRTKSYLADGFLSVGSPAFDCMSGRTVDTGFNIIKLSFASTHQICEVEVQQILLEKGKSVFSQQLDRFDLALDRIPVEDANRWLILPAVNRILYSKQRLDGLIRAVDDPSFTTTHSSTLRGFLGNFQDIKAVYALSVFPPSLWISSKVPDVFLPFANAAYGKAVRAAGGVTLKKDSGEVPLLFSFSSPLYRGLLTAIENSRKLPVVDIARSLHKSFRMKREEIQQHNGQRSQGEEFLRRVLDRATTKSTSLSVWGQASFTLPTAHSQFKGIRVQELKGRPHQSFRHKQKSERRFNSSLCEFPRIVLWEQDVFRRPSALDVIEYHENLRLPLFWLDPKSIVDSYKRVRGKIGYVAAIAMNYNDGTPVINADGACHTGNDDNLNQTLELSQFWERTWGTSEFFRPTDDELLAE